ncbi:hypothetical protein EYF80_056750 [Liparis tanakae]|uniref:Uncharacterized protein n=1 Tax=Liparis tanakae TaxID=230148 RepID=A0A4Z2EWA8_9TELE|nr:hypothetical protein EYF80_056750 [Liparis tanakae]
MAAAFTSTMLGHRVARCGGREDVQQADDLRRRRRDRAGQRRAESGGASPYVPEGRRLTFSCFMCLSSRSSR